MLTRSGVNKILRRIMETGGMTEDMERDVQRLKDELDEREGVLRRYGEVYDGEDRDEYEYKQRDTDTIYTPREEEKISEDWKGRYEEMRQRYLDRFFGGVDARSEEIRDEIRDDFREDFEITMRDTEKDVKRDAEPQTFDELLERTES